jgi:glycogen phosphorylase
MAVLAPTYSSSRMAREYVEQYYLAGAAELRRRMSNGDQPAREMRCWELRLRGHWSDLHIGEKTVGRDGTTWSFSVPVDLGGVAPQDVAVQLYAEPRNGGQPFVGELSTTPSNPGIYIGSAPASRPAEEYTVRIIPRHTGVAVPAELPLILWQK